MKIKLLLLTLLLSFGVSSAQRSEFFINLGQAVPIRGGDMGTFGVGVLIPTAIEPINFHFGINKYESLKPSPIDGQGKESFSTFYTQLGVNIVDKEKVLLSLLGGFHLRGRLSNEPTTSTSYFGPYLGTFFKVKVSNHVAFGAWGTIGFANDFTISEARLGILFQ